MVDVVSNRHRLVAAGAIALLATSCAGDAAVPEAPCPASPFRATPPLVIAHAGGEGLAPGNTILAMQRSMDEGADLLDADLWMSSDGVIVARHDRDLSATTGGTGNIDEQTWAEIQRLDTRTHWSGAAIDEPVGVPSLEQILEAFPDTRISLEIKQTAPSIAVALCDVLVRTNSVDRVYLSANDDNAVYEAQARCPETVIITTTYRDLGEMRAARDSGATWCAPAPIGQPPYAEGRFSPSDVQWSHDHGMAIYTWTVDDPTVLRKLALAGVDAVYTRRPDIARAVFDEMAASSSA